MQNILSRVNSIMGQFDSVSRNLDWDIRAESNINSRLSGISRELSAEARGISGMKNYLGNAVRQYNTVENINKKNKLKDEVSGHNSGTHVKNNNSKTNKTGGTSTQFGGNAPWIIGKDGKPGKYVQYKDKKAISDSINDASEFYTGKKVIPKQKKIPIYRINKDVDWYGDPKGTIAEVKREAKIEGSVIDAKASGSAKYAQGEISAKVVTGEAHASANAGLYVFEKGPDGEVKRVLSPAVKAEVGTSGAIIDVAASGRVGLGEDNNMLGAYGKGEVKLGSAEAKAKASLSTKEAYFGASAEADLVKAEGTAGVSVLGTDIGVSGAAKFGIGAHAEVGCTDGKFKADVGLAVGLGVDIGFEVDISGTVDAVTGWAESALDKVKWW